ncbi:hypothetical protein [Anaerobaca lacustris]|uniref:Uncharacterized protein n=1 Tax=Anaerobaca lacustris TaxID=3044600 RepID=A0AAW6U119_9BACT|nr:hypothetical protein [Sedimentisphaerales bacterium M17dextr]
MRQDAISCKLVVLLLATVASCACARSRVGLHGYTAAVDDVSGEVLRVGQKLVHLGFEVPLGETVAPVPILSVQYAGRHHRASPAASGNHAEARAKSIAERLLHAWTLMDHGARLEVAPDDWNTFGARAQADAPPCPAVYVRSPVAGAEPLRILTVYPEDVAGYPWIASEKSLADYLANLIWAHYMLFWRNETDLSKYRALPLHRTSEGRVFTEIATRAVEAGKRGNLVQFDGTTVREVLAAMPLSERQRLYRLATAPPMDWESALK